MQNICNISAGTYYTAKNFCSVKYYQLNMEDYLKADQTLDLNLIRETLTEATRKTNEERQ
jgi:asparagine synthase (glutamine-hydrolysing)